MINSITLNCKSLVFMALLAILPSGCMRKSNQKACEVFEKNLSLIKDAVARKKGLNFAEVSTAMLDLEDVTGIISHSDLNYGGRFNPTAEDYSNWSGWFEKNRSRLYWNADKRRVEVSPPER